MEGYKLVPTAKNEISCECCELKVDGMCAANDFECFKNGGRKHYVKIKKEQKNYLTIINYKDMKTEVEKSCNNCWNHYRNGNKCNARPCYQGDKWVFYESELPESNLPESKTGRGNCPDCDGFGYTAEHNPADPHPDGECSGSCPIQVECQKCMATGWIQEQPKSSIAEKIKPYISNEEAVVSKWIREDAEEQPKIDMIKLIDKYWKFDEGQYPISSWHDKQDLIKLLSENIFYPINHEPQIPLLKSLAEKLSSKIDEQPMSAYKILRRELSEYYWDIITKPDAEGHTTFKDWIIEAMEEYAQSKAQPKVTDEMIIRYALDYVSHKSLAPANRGLIKDALIIGAKALRDGKIPDPTRCTGKDLEDADNAKASFRDNFPKVSPDRFAKARDYILRGNHLK